MQTNKIVSIEGYTNREQLSTVSDNDIDEKPKKATKPRQLQQPLIQITEGFPEPVKNSKGEYQNYTMIFHDWENMLQGIDNRPEEKIVRYAMRHSWGFEEGDGTRNKLKKITIDEFMFGRKLKDGTRMDDGTHLSFSAVQDGTERAVKHGFLCCDVDDSDKARVKKSYCVNIIKRTTNPESEESGPFIEGEDTRYRQTIIPQSNPSRQYELDTMPYTKYLETPEWKSKSAKAKRYAGFRCQLCNSNENLVSHHRTYERRGHELLGDLTVLCQDCHDIFNYNRTLA